MLGLSYLVELFSGLAGALIGAFVSWRVARHQIVLTQQVMLFDELRRAMLIVKRLFLFFDSSPQFYGQEGAQHVEDLYSSLISIQSLMGVLPKLPWFGAVAEHRRTLQIFSQFYSSVHPEARVMTSKKMVKVAGSGQDPPVVLVRRLVFLCSLVSLSPREFAREYSRYRDDFSPFSCPTSISPFLVPAHYSESL